MTSKSWAPPAGLPGLKRWPVAGQAWDRPRQARRGNARDSRPTFLAGKTSCDTCIVFGRMDFEPVKAGTDKLSILQKRKDDARRVWQATERYVALHRLLGERRVTQA